MTTLERLYERRERLLDVIHAAGITTSEMPASTIVHNAKMGRDAKRELLEVQALIDAVQD